MYTVAWRNPAAALFGSLVVAVGMLGFAPSGVAQSSDAASPADADDAQSDDLQPVENIPGLTPVASYVVPDEITVRGTRPGEIRARLWDLDTNIESTINDFYGMLNDIVVDEQFHVICEWGNVQVAPGVESRIKQRFCYTGYQLEELRAKRDFERDGGVYEPDQAWLAQKEEEFAEVVFAAMESYPGLVVAAEDLVRMHEEREYLTGGDPAMSLAQLDRQRARESVRGPFERREQRRQRDAEREAEREAERQARRNDERP